MLLTRQYKGYKGSKEGVEMYQEKSPVSSLHSSVVSNTKIVYGNILCSRRTHGKPFVFLQNFISVSLLVTILTGSVFAVKLND